MVEPLCLQTDFTPISSHLLEIADRSGDLVALRFTGSGSESGLGFGFGFGFDS
jgi:hypothetical protein